MIPIIICGGVGTKMWPLSTSTLPKHFLPLVDGKSLFQANWEMLRKRYKPEEIYLQTNASQAKTAHSQVGELLKENIFIEPETKNTGPAIGLAAAYLKKIGKGDDIFMLIQVDDLRTPDDAIFDFIDLAEQKAKETGKYVTSGFVPKWYQSGVDYILKGKLLSKENGIKVFEVADYVDRSEPERIKEHLSKGDLFMHTNHTCMTPNNLLKMYQKYKPEWYKPLENIVNGASINEEFSKMPKGVQEEITQQAHRNGESIIIENPFEWIDFGTWEAISKYYDDKGYFAPSGGSVELDGDSNFLWSASGKIIATIGVSDLVVVESEEGILITKKESSGKVGQVVEKISSGDV